MHMQKSMMIMRSLSKRAFSATTVTASVCGTKHTNPFLFPGQGSQFIGMPKVLASSSQVTKSLFDKASGILGYDLLEICTNGPVSKLNSTAVAQSAIFVSSMAALEVFKQEAPEVVESCTVAMGLSLGEYSALCFAGCFSFEDGVKLIKVRGECMQVASNAEPSGMLAINGLGVSDLREICAAAKIETGEDIFIGNYLSEMMSTLSGSKNACTASLKIAQQKGAKTATILPVAGAFHSRFMDSAAKPLADALDTIKLNMPRISVYANYDGSVYKNTEEIKCLLVKQVNHPVQWSKIMNSVLTCPSFNKHCFEIGPGNVCKGIVKIINRRVEVTSRE